MFSLYLGEFELNKMQHAMSSYHMLEGTEQGRKMDEDWLKSKQNKPRDSSNDPNDR